MEMVRRHRNLIAVALFALFFPLIVARYLLVPAESAGAAPAPAGPAEPAPTETPYPAGWWQRHTNAADGYSLALPPEWQIVSLEPGSQAATAGPGEEATIAQRLSAWAEQNASAGLGVWMAKGPDGPLGAATSLNVIRQPLGQDVPVETFAEANLASLRKEQGLLPLTNRWLTLSAGRALFTETPREETAAANDGGLYIAQVYLVHGQNGYIVTAATRRDQAQDNAPVFEGIIRSLRWLEDLPASSPSPAPPHARLNPYPSAQ